MRRAVDAKSLMVPIILLLYCGSAQAFVGADIADRTVERYTVAVVTAKGLCSGVVLAQNIVLTAAHCVRADPNVQVHGNPVIETVLHPLYGSADARAADLAILKLANPLPHRFIPAVVNPRSLSKGIDLIAAGYGHSSIKDHLAGTALRMVVLRVFDTGKDWVALVSARIESSGAGPGDSGSPVYAYRGMYSVVALIVGGSGEHIIAVALAGHYPWIMDTVQRLGAP